LGERREAIFLSKKETRTFKFSKEIQVRGVVTIRCIFILLFAWHVL